MPLSVSTIAVLKKNALNDTGAWLLLVEVAYPGEEIVRVVYNNEPIEWNGYTYQPADFNLGGVEQSKDSSLPTVPLSILDISRTLTPIVMEHDGAIGADVAIKLVHSDNLANLTPELEENFKIITCSIDSKNVIKFDLGAANLINYRLPQDRYLKDHCRHKDFKGVYCKYSGIVTECDRTFATCKSLVNQANFGGFPGIGSGGYFE